MDDTTSVGQKKGNYLIFIDLTCKEMFSSFWDRLREVHIVGAGGVRCSRVGAVALCFCVCREWHLSRIFSTSFIDLAQCDCHFPSLFEALRISSIWKFWFVSALLGKTLYAIINDDFEKMP